jgi:phosphoglycerate transporter family protein
MFGRILATLRIPPDAPPLEISKQAIGALYRYWRVRTLYAMVIGYAVFYFVRKNFSIANPRIREDLGISATEMGFILGAHLIVYGVSKFLSGIVADRSNARYFMAIGLALSAVLNFCFGFSSSIYMLGMFWIMNGLVQGSGVPPCSRMITAWFPRKSSGVAWGLWNSSHQIGGAVIAILAGWLAVSYGWRFAFFVPAGIALFVAVFLINRLRDRPESLGLPPVEDHHNELEREAGPAGAHLSSAPIAEQPSAPAPIAESASEATPIAGATRTPSTRELLFQHVFNQPAIWFVCFANFFVYIVRLGFLDWGTSYLEEVGLAKESGGTVIAVFEITGLLGAFAAGFLSDRFTGGRRAPVSILFMLGLIAALTTLWMAPGSGFYYLAGLFGAVGFLVYGPQMLVAVVAANAAPKAAGAAVGLTGLFGYLGSTVCSPTTGILLDHYGADAVMLFYLGSAIVGTALFILSASRESAAAA